MYHIKPYVELYPVVMMVIDFHQHKQFAVDYPMNILVNIKFK